MSAVIFKFSRSPVNFMAAHGIKFIDRVEALAKKDQQFRKLLGVIPQNNIPGSPWVRIKAIAAKPCKAVISYREISNLIIAQYGS